MFHFIIMPIGLLAGILLFLCLPRLKNITQSRPDISVVIPARNEAANIGNLVADLMAQTLKPFEIICVDDESTDETTHIAGLGGARVIQAGTHPDGWIGKTWACQQGANVARGKALLFLDADVRLLPDALEKIAAEYHDGVVSVQPYHVVKRFVEHFSLFFNIISVAATGIGMPLIKPIGMFGPVLLLPKALYDEHGGHKVVKSVILEDFNLGKYYHRQGIPVKLFLGRPSISYRMYSDFRSLWQGWTKNFFSGAVGVSFPMLLMCIVWLTALTGCFVSLINALEYGASG